MKIAAAVILYYPDDDCLKFINTYKNNVQIVYVADNTEDPPSGIRETIKQLAGIVYLHDGANKGIAYRLNQICEQAIKDGFDWLLTMDQDSFFDRNHVLQYLSCIQKFNNRDATSMFGVQYEEQSFVPGECQPVETNQLITSGSILNLRLFPNVGGFDEKLFIDEVDLEFCYRSITLGYRIIEFRNIFLNHHLGTVFIHRSLKNFQKTPRVLHSPVRVYYMIRNYLYVNARYKADRFRKDLPCRRKALFHRLKNNFLYGSQRIKLLKYTFRAFIDFYRGKMGKYKAT